IPAICELYSTGRIPNHLHIIGFARRDWTEDHMKEVFTESIRENSEKEIAPESLEKIFSKLKYIQSSFDQSDGYELLKQYLMDEGIKNVLFYLATPPESYETI